MPSELASILQSNSSASVDVHKQLPLVAVFLPFAMAASLVLILTTGAYSEIAYQDQVNDVSSQQHHSQVLGVTTTANGVLLKKSGDPTVFLISNGRKHGFVSSQVFVGLGYRWNNIHEVAGANLDNIKLSGNISNITQAHWAGSYVNQDATIYHISFGYKQAVSSLAVWKSQALDGGLPNLVIANEADRSLPVGIALK